MKIGYLIPEFPGQTHIWMWREIVHLREGGVDVELFSTRMPPKRDLARHAFAESAIEQTTFLWPQRLRNWLPAVLGSALLHPIGFFSCVKLALMMPFDPLRSSRKKLVSLLIPACILARESRRRNITHLHVHSCGRSAVLAMMLKRLVSIPYSLTLNADLWVWGGGLMQKFREAEFTIAITKWMEQQLRDDFSCLREDQIVWGGIGVDTQKWVPDGHDLGADREFRIVSVSRLHVVKGQDVLLKAISQLYRAGRDISLLLMGDGPQRHELEHLAKELGIEQRVTFAGSVAEDRIIEEMKSADAFVLASVAEPLGVAYMEAMAMELPTIGTRAGGVPEIITDGVDGLLVEPKDENGLALAIAKLIDDKDLRIRLGKAGRQTIVTKFDSRVGAGVLLNRIRTTAHGSRKYINGSECISVNA